MPRCGLFRYGKGLYQRTIPLVPPFPEYVSHARAVTIGKLSRGAVLWRHELMAFMRDAPPPGELLAQVQRRVPALWRPFVQQHGATLVKNFGWELRFSGRGLVARSFAAPGARHSTASFPGHEGRAPIHRLRHPDWRAALGRRGGRPTRPEPAARPQKATLTTRSARTLFPCRARPLCGSPTGTSRATRRPASSSSR